MHIQIIQILFYGEIRDLIYWNCSCSNETVPITIPGVRSVQFTMFRLLKVFVSPASVLHSMVYVSPYSHKNNKILIYSNSNTVA